MDFYVERSSGRAATQLRQSQRAFSSFILSLVLGGTGGKTSLLWGTGYRADGILGYIILLNTWNMGKNIFQFPQ